MAEILADRDIYKLLGKCIINGSPDCIKSNSYELRLGTKIRFKSTGEIFNLEPDQHVKIEGGQSVDVTSFEKIDFRKNTIEEIFKDKMLLGIINTRTTLMREGISQVSTKIDPGFFGHLDWEFRNSSYKPIILSYGEKLFNLLIFKLSEDEKPDRVYSEHPEDKYQGSEGLQPSARRILADIPPQKIITASKLKIDHKAQLKEYGPPISHIGEELTRLDSEVRSIHTKIADSEKTLKEKIDSLKISLQQFLSNKFIQYIGLSVGLVAIIGGVFRALASNPRLSNALTPILIIIGIMITVLSVFFMTKKP